MVCAHFSIHCVMRCSRFEHIPTVSATSPSSFEPGKEKALKSCRHHHGGRERRSARTRRRAGPRQRDRGKSDRQGAETEAPWRSDAGAGELHAMGYAPDEAAPGTVSDLGAAVAAVGEVFVESHIIDTIIKPVHLTATGNALSSDPDAVNCRANLCPKITEWLLGRTGQWECAGYVDGSCLRQHKCKAGIDCDELHCFLEHPPDESRWIVLCNKKKQYWAVAMTMDEAIHHDEDEGTMSALTTGDEGCTYADVWRASVRAVAYGRRKRVAPADVKPASAALTKKPAAATAVTKKPVVPIAAPVAVAAPPANAADKPATTDNKMHLTLPTANTAAQPTLPSAATKITQSGAKQQSVDQQQRVIAPPKKIDQDEAAKREREAADPASALEQERPPKRARRFSAEDKVELLRVKDGNCLHFIELTNAYIAHHINLRGYKCGYLTFCPNFQVEPNRIFEARKQVWERLRTFENLDKKLDIHICIPVD